MKENKKNIFEDFAKFFENPKRETLRDLLKNNYGELDNLDFKENLPSHSKLAKHILGFSNSGGGCLIVGVSEDDEKHLQPVGIEKIIDKTEIINGVKKYLPTSMLDKINILDFPFNASEYDKIAGKSFQAILVEEDLKHVPNVCISDGENIRQSAVYVRRGVSTEEANYEELQKIINQRISTGYNSTKELDLQSHLEQLKMLYRQLNRYIESGMGLFAPLNEAFSEMLKKMNKPNPSYPKEDYESFILKAIDKKKKRILIELDVNEL